MFSVIVTTSTRSVPASPSAEAVARTLASLVPGAVSGVLRDVAMAGPATPDMERIADDAGCELAAADDWVEAVEKALKAAREPRVVVLQAGYAPEIGFFDELTDMGREAELHPARLLERSSKTLYRALPFFAPLAGIAASRAALAQIQRQAQGQAQGQAQVQDFDGWARRLGRLRTMRTSARRVD